MAVDTTPPRSRRALLAAGLGGLAATLAHALGRPSAAAAANGDPILIGQPNSGSGATTLTSSAVGAGFQASVGEGTGLIGVANGPDGISAGVVGQGTGPTTGVRGTSGSGYALWGIGQGATKPAAVGISKNSSTGVVGYSTVLADGDQVGTVPAKTGVYGFANQDATARGVTGRSPAGFGVEGTSDTGKGVRGVSVSGTAIQGLSTNGTGVSSSSTNGKAHYASNATASYPAILAQNIAPGAAIQGYSGTGVPPAPTAQTGLMGTANQSIDANGVQGRSSVGTGVWGATTDGVGVIGTGTGVNSVGVYGAGGVGVYADGGLGLIVNGPAIFSASGKKTISSGSSTTVSVPGGLGAASIALALLQTNKPGVWVRAITQSVAAGTITIYLNTSVSTSTTIGWFVIN